jgi:opacity protein-like surface antigen
MCVRIAAAAVAAVCLITPAAWAQDAPIPPPALKFYDWTGVYLGAHVAYGNATVSDTAAGTTTSQGASGVLGGGQIGTNYQFGQVVVGGEVDGDWSSLSSSGGTSDFKIPWLATARLRIGGAYDRIWLFATGGIATVKYTPATIAGVIPVSDTSRRTAWVAGVGSESAINRNLIFQFEILYLQLLANSSSVVPATTSSERVSEFIVRVGLSYKFNWRD